MTPVTATPPPDSMATLTRSRVSATTRRAKAFKMALVAADLTPSQWCAQHGYSRHHINEVLRGRRQSPVVDLLIKQFIARHLR